LRTGFAAFFVGAAAVVGLGFACLPDLPTPPPAACGSGTVDLDDGEACDPGPGEAGSTGCNRLCQVDCDGGVVDDASNHCYFWVSGVGSLDLATQACLGLGAHIVSFVDMTELSFVAGNTKTLDNAVTGGSWAALERYSTPDEAGHTLYYVPNEQLPGWASSCAGCFAYTDAADIPLPTNNNPGSCVYWRHALSTSWVQANCNLGFDDAGVQNTNSVLCEREPPGSFSAPCAGDANGRTCIEVPVTHTKKRYELSPSGTFDNARGDCTSRGGILVHFASAAEREEVSTEVARSIATTDFWIGLSFDDDAGVWTWADGSTGGPFPWADLEPSSNAGAAAIHFDNGPMTNLAYASDRTTTHPYVCEFAK
jgi:hypothetical protein